MQTVEEKHYTIFVGKEGGEVFTFEVDLGKCFEYVKFFADTAVAKGGATSGEDLVRYGGKILYGLLDENMTKEKFLAPPALSMAYLFKCLDNCAHPIHVIVKNDGFRIFADNGKKLRGVRRLDLTV